MVMEEFGYQEAVAVRETAVAVRETAVAVRETAIAARETVVAAREVFARARRAVGADSHEVTGFKHDDSILTLTSASEYSTWWVGGSVCLLGVPANTPVWLMAHGLALSSAVTDADGCAKFFGGTPRIPVGYADHLTVRVGHPGLTGEAWCQCGPGPELRTPLLTRSGIARGGKHIICAIPVDVLSQTWEPHSLSPSSWAAGANNELLITTERAMFMRWGR